MVKEVIYCVECCLCVKDHGCGFVPFENMICSRDEGGVDVDDGCTRGVQGEPMFLKRTDVITLFDDTAKYGDHEE